MKLVLVKKGRVECEREVREENLPPFYRLVLSDSRWTIGLHEETQLAPRHHGEYYALWGESSHGVAVYVYVEPEHVWATEWWIDDVLVRTDIGGAEAPAFLSVFPGGVIVPRETPGDPHPEKKLYVLHDLTLQSPWHRKAAYKRADVVYYQDPPMRPLKRLLDV